VGDQSAPILEEITSELGRIIWGDGGRSMRAFGETPPPPLETNRLLLRGRGRKTMDEMEEGKQKFLEVVKGTDAAVQVVMPVTPSNSMFLISLTKGPNRKFITISEDDIIDLPNEAGILAKVTKTVKDAVSAL
jgi:hypothetical protein